MLSPTGAAAATTAGESTLRSFLQSGFTPRRRSGRRADEQHLPIDWHEPYCCSLSLMILLLNVADAFLTLTLITVGAQEANPMLAFVLERAPEAVRGHENGAHEHRRARPRRGRARQDLQHHARRHSCCKAVFVGVRRT